jgi:hypothetical protein
MKEDFVLPEKWYIKTDEESNDTVCDWYDKIKKTKTDRTIGNFYCVDGSDKPRGWMYYAPDRIDGYTKISFKKFKKYVLGMKEQEQQKEIVGWRLKEEFSSCKDAALKLCGTTGNWENCLMNYDISVSQTKYTNKLKQAGVLDLWFEPVYKKEETFCVGDWVWSNTPNCCRKELGGDFGFVGKLMYNDHGYHDRYKVSVDKSIYPKYDGSNSDTSTNTCYVWCEKVRKATAEEIKAAQTPQIVVNGYSAKFHDEYVEFGCATISKYVFIGLSKIKHDTTNRDVESVTIGKGTFTKEQIKAIAEYYLNKK